MADTAFRAARQARTGETILGESFTFGPGGKASNRAVAAGRAGAELQFVSRIGCDGFGDMATWRWASGQMPASRPQ